MKEILTQKLETLKSEALSSFLASQSEEDLYQVKVRYLGKKGLLTDILKNLGQLNAQDRPQVGSLANQLRSELETLYQNRNLELKNQKIETELQQEKIDVTLPGFQFPQGHSHPISQVLSEMKEIFRKMGFDIHEGPEIETDYYNFEALNIPANHPARDMQDTFYIGGPVRSAFGGSSDTPQSPTLHAGKASRSASDSLLLRTHTSPVQIRVMEKQKPPIYMVAPGAVYRCDSDVSHTPMFHQVEGLVVDQGIHLGHLKGVLEVFLKKVFSANTKVRFRPSYFPFTEPSAEVDIQCVFCGGTGKLQKNEICRVCKKTGWLEIMGCGMVDPEVFKGVRLDSEIYTGFAFGIGIERVAMLKYGINDIRLFFENKKEFLEQF